MEFITEKLGTEDDDDDEEEEEGAEKEKKGETKEMIVEDKEGETIFVGQLILFTTLLLKSHLTSSLLLRALTLFTPSLHPFSSPLPFYPSRHPFPSTLLLNSPLIPISSRLPFTQSHFIPCLHTFSTPVPVSDRPHVIRSKGFFWLASRTEEMMLWYAYALHFQLKWKHTRTSLLLRMHAHTYAVHMQHKFYMCFRTYTPLSICAVFVTHTLCILHARTHTCTFWFEDCLLLCSLMST